VNVKKTILITGTSSGIGKETAVYFLEKGWNVVATMRHPENRETELHKIDGLDIVHLDVTDTASIQEAMASTLKKYGRIDAIINNAGYPLMGPFELSTEEQVESQFNTNILGLMRVTREIIPIFRRQREGVIINVASMGGRVSFPMYGAYNATKWAVEGFSESMKHELAPFGIKIRIIEPGVIKTDFYGRSMERIEEDKLGDYAEFVRLFERNTQLAGIALQPKKVAQVIFNAVTNKGEKLRYPVGSDAKVVSLVKKLLPEWLFLKVLSYFLNKK
jgi:NAD(P)-dependent dehydrogenase (short-subunit alcohol dehydrogenase family)